MREWEHRVAGARGDRPAARIRPREQWAAGRAARRRLPVSRRSSGLHLRFLVVPSGRLARLCTCAGVGRSASAWSLDRRAAIVPGLRSAAVGRFTPSMEFRLLGALEVEDDGRVLALGGSKPRTLLASLLLRANAVVGRDVLVEELWGGDQP